MNRAIAIKTNHYELAKAQKYIRNHVVQSPVYGV